MNGNFKVRCVKDCYLLDDLVFKNDKIYEFKDGICTREDGGKSGPYSDFNELMNRNNSYKGYLIECQTSSYESISIYRRKNKVVATISDGENKYTQHIKLSDCGYDLKAAVKMVIDRVIDRFNPVEIKPDIIIGDEPTYHIIKQDKYEINDRVKVKKDLYKMATDGVFNIWTDMCRFSENIVTITEAKETEWGMRYSIEGSPRRWIAECFDGKVMEDTAVNSFDWTGFKAGKFAVHCDTKEKAREFLKECDVQGIKWHGNQLAPSHTNWDVYKEKTIYDYKFGLGFCDISGSAHKLYGWEIIDYTPSKPIVNEVNRIAQPNEWIKIVSPIYNGLVSEKDYRKGDVLKVRKRESIETLTTYGHDGKPINDTEYVVLEGYIPKDEPTIKEVNEETVEFYCVKDKCSEIGRSLTKGKTYEFKNGHMAFDEGIEGYEWKSFESWKNVNRGSAQCLVRVLHRLAKVGEWIRVVNGDPSYGKYYKNGDITKVIKIGASRSTVFTEKEPCKAIHYSEYVVLENYQPESKPEEPDRTSLSECTQEELIKELFNRQSK